MKNRESTRLEHVASHLSRKNGGEGRGRPAFLGSPNKKPERIAPAHASSFSILLFRSHKLPLPSAAKILAHRQRLACLELHLA